MKIKLLLVSLLSLKVLAQQPYILLSETKELKVNPKLTSNAVFIYYDYDYIRLTCGSPKVPKTQQVIESVKDFMQRNYVPVQVLFVYDTPISVVDNAELTDLLTEKRIEQIITLSFLPMQDTEFMASQGSSGTHPAFNEKMSFGLLSSVKIARFSGNELLYTPNSEIFSKNTASIPSLFDELRDLLMPLEKASTSFTTDLVYDLTKNGQIKNDLPSDLNSASIFVYEKEIFEIYGKPVGAVQKISAKSIKSANKSVPSHNEVIRNLCSNYQLNFSFYSYSLPIPENNKSGYLLLSVICHYDLANVLADVSAFGEEGDLEASVYNEFARKSVPGINNAATWSDPDSYRYYYLKDLATGDIYVVDYDVKTGIAEQEALQTYLDFVAKK